jgi:hypothetical protein
MVSGGVDLLDMYVEAEKLVFDETRVVASNVQRAKTFSVAVSKVQLTR